MRKILHGPALRTAAVFGATRAPRWFVRWAPTWIGFVLSLLLRRERARVRANLRLIYGQRSWARESLDIARTFEEFAHSLTLGMTRDRFEPPIFDVYGREFVEPRLSSASGFVLGTCHVGSWDLVIQLAFAGKGRSVLIVMGGEGEGSGQQVHDRARDDRVGVIRVGKHPLDALPALRHLQGGGIVATQLDRVVGASQVRSGELFGQPCSVAVGPFLLAALARVPLIPVFTARISDGRYLVRLDEPIDLPERPSEAELGAAVTRALRSLEAHIRAFPTQWFAFR
jgi:lauroyl/myristoyl acyltransferase